MQKALKAAGAQAKIIAPRLGTLKTAQGHDVKIDWSFLTAGSVLFDAVFVPGGDKSLKTLMAEPRAVEFVAEAYKHCKAIGATGQGTALLQAAGVSMKDRKPASKGRKPSGPEGVVFGRDADMNGVAGKFIQAVAQHRAWSRDDVIARMLRWSQDFIEQPHRVFGGLPICPFAKAAVLRQSIRFEVLCFSAADPFESGGRVMTLIGEFLGDKKFETLFVIHPEPELIGARALEASVARLKARLTSRAATRGLQVFEAHPESAFCLGGVYTRRSLLKDASDALLGSSYDDHFTPEMLRAVGMPHDMPSRTMLETSVRCSRLVPPHCRSRGGPSLRATTPDHRPIPLYPDDP